VLRRLRVQSAHLLRRVLIPDVSSSNITLLSSMSVLLPARGRSLR
jgi:hypothetical protein